GLDQFKEEKAKDPLCVIDPMRGVVLLAAIAEAFDKGESVTATDVGGNIAATPDDVHAALQALENAGLIHQIERPDDEPARWMLSKPPHSLKLCDVIASLAPDVDG